MELYTVVSIWQSNKQMRKSFEIKGGLFDNMYHLWHRFSEQINIANVHSPQI